MSEAIDNDQLAAIAVVKAPIGGNYIMEMSTDTDM